MADQDHRNGCLPEIEGQSPHDTTGQDDTVASEPLDPRSVTIARAIGRLIARERFREEQTEPPRHKDR